MTKLYTAAEARRIDIERGGEGCIKLKDRNDHTFIFDKKQKIWIANKRGNVTINEHMILGKVYLPVTSEPEQEENMVELWQQLDKLKQAEIKIEQLEKELAELKKERDHDVHYRLYSSMQKERDEYKDNYHEILADHGELTRKFDELKEKQLSKEDFQLIQIGRLILEVNKRAWELREADL